MIIIGIAGGSGSGKTTVVKRIAKALPPHCAAIIPLDSYYNDTTDLTPEERKQINFDHPDAFDWKLLTEQIKKLRNGEAVEQPTYSYVLSNRLPETVHIEPKPVIILEGIMTLHHKKLRDMMDLKIFVDTDSDVRLIRNIRRDVVERGRTVDMVLDHYENDVKPMHEQFIEPTKKFADLIIPWGRENKRGIDILRTYISGFSEEVREEMKEMMEVEAHPFEPFLPENARLLMLGTFPPSEKRWSVRFFYPNYINDMWRIAGLLFFHDKDYFVDAAQKRFRLDLLIPFLREQGIALFDTATRIRRTTGTASDKDLEIVEETDLHQMSAAPSTLRKHRHSRTTGHRDSL